MDPRPDASAPAPDHEDRAQLATSVPTSTAARSTNPLPWVVGAIVVGVAALAAGVIVAAAVLVRAGDPGDIGGPAPPVTAGGPLEAAARCRAEQPVSMQIDFVVPATTIDGAESTAKSQVGEAYAVTTWVPIETGPGGSAWYGVTADATVAAVFEVEGAGSGWVVGDIRRC
jgi:hypothetical protein